MILPFFFLNEGLTVTQIAAKWSRRLGKGPENPEVSSAARQESLHSPLDCDGWEPGLGLIRRLLALDQKASAGKESPAPSLYV